MTVYLESRDSFLSCMHSTFKSLRFLLQRLRLLQFHCSLYKDLEHLQPHSIIYCKNEVMNKQWSNEFFVCSSLHFPLHFAVNYAVGLEMLLKRIYNACIHLFSLSFQRCLRPLLILEWQELKRLSLEKPANSTVLSRHSCLTTLT